MCAQIAVLESSRSEIQDLAQDGFRLFAESLIQHIDEVFFWRDAETIAPYFVSHSFERIFGRSCSSVYQQPSSWIESIHPDDRLQALQAQEWRAHSRKLEAEYRIVKPNGEIRWISVRMFPVSSKDHNILVGIAQDCTDRVQAEAAQEFLAAIVRGSEEGIVGTDLNGRILSWNHGAEKLFGYSAEEAIGRSVTLLVPANDQDASWTALERAKSGQEVERYEATRLAKSGAFVDVSVSLSPVRNRRGQPIGISAIYRDIAQQKRVAIELMQAKEAAEEASRAKSEFLANMSHEIRTPMNGVLGMAEVLLETELTDEQREYVEIVQYSATSLLTIINDILDFSKIEAKKLTLEHRQFRLRELMASVLKEMEIHAQKQGLTLACSTADDVPEVVSGDSGRIRQILVNLVNNGIKFTRRGGVEVRITKVAGATELVQFDVLDTGIGVPADKQKSIFNPFVQADGSARRKAGGTGLGLTISSRLVELMNGRIWMESSDRGSIFHFTVQLPEVLDA